MLALFHLVIAIVLGALICRRFYRFASPLYYVTASFLIGILLSTWFTYLFALLLTWSKKPLVGAAILFFLLAICLIYVFRPRPSSCSSDRRASGIDPEGGVTERLFQTPGCALFQGCLRIHASPRRVVAG